MSILFCLFIWWSTKVPPVLTHSHVTAVQACRLVHPPTGQPLPGTGCKGGQGTKPSMARQGKESSRMSQIVGKNLSLKHVGHS